MTSRLGMAVGAAALALPLASWFAVGPSPSPAATILDTPIFLFTALGLIAAGVALATLDRYLGAFVVLVAALAIVAGTHLALAIAHWCALGAGLIVVMRRADPRPLVAVAVAVAFCEIGIAALQALRFDPLWWGMAVPPYFVVHGTYGNPKFYAAFLALVTPLAPSWSVPILLGGIALPALVGSSDAFGWATTGSLLAAMAALAGWLVRPALGGNLLLRYATILGGVLLLPLMLASKSADSFNSRLGAWTLALRDLAWGTTALGGSPLFGWGPGSWYTHVPSMQFATTFWPPELFLYAHNDFIQLAYETGLAGMALLVLWLWSHRAMILASPYRGALVSLAVLASGVQVMHLPHLAPAGLVVMGLVTSPVRVLAADVDVPAASWWCRWRHSDRFRFVEGLEDAGVMVECPRHGYRMVDTA